MASTKLDHGATPASEQSRIPDFKSMEEAAEFWDTHDSAAFADDWEEVDGEIRWVVTDRNGRISFTLSEEEYAALHASAQKDRMGPGSLALQWVLERLKAS